MKLTSAMTLGCATGLALGFSAGPAKAAYGYSDYNSNPYSTPADPYRDDSARRDDRYYDNGRRGALIRCESREQRTVYCGYNVSGNVRLVRRSSQASCIRGRTWGVDRGRLWVSRGCRAQFQVDTDRYGDDDRYGSGYGNDYGNGNGSGYGYGYGYGYGNRQARLLVCESRGGRYNFCGVGNAGQVQIRRQLSDTRCLQNSTWGYRNGGVWVDRGCRAEFVIY